MPGSNKTKKNVDMDMNTLVELMVGRCKLQGYNNE